MIQIELKNRLLGEEFWTNLYQQANDSAQPPPNPFAQMLQAAQSPISELSAEKMLWQSLRVKTGYDDTHPALAERLSRLGVDAESLARDSALLTFLSVNGDDPGGAAERYLRLLPQEIIEEFDRLWREQLTQTWQQRHEHVQQTVKRLNELEHKLQQQPLTIAEKWERVQAIGKVQGPVATLTVAKEILTEHPDHAGANWVLGAVLVEQHDPSGVEYLEKAMQLDPSATGVGCELIYDFYRGEGMQREAETYRLRSEQYDYALQRHHEQAMNLSAYDRYEPHGLESSELAELQSQLANIRGLGTAYLVRKPVEGASEPLYVLAVLAAAVWVNGRSQKDISGLLNELGAQLEFSRSTAFVSLDAKPFLANPISHVPHAQIYPAT